ncbi:P-loop containing nucleoside triphosphate hydrolase protein [Terfezia boudieri ATCC MYA-4762]|uniref:P-loop containing nucleoside triphosphate hydrolase protein n=1 Tax=Terfezia boudieri ATCC MYA-4762 TaxID=1051890 RepID=A0A3N4MH69_9PEZI|nr:P-loop containing nucleoside triphosphate hydrolase protein [Terfezia boudieri ATCC MYA-4762]
MPTYVISISGPTASGKTTLSRLLLRIFDGLTFTPRTRTTSTPISISTTILHQDDFYFPETEIPIKCVPKEDTPGEYEEQRDWDCPEAIDFGKLKCCLKKFRDEGCAGPEDHARILDELGIKAIEAENSVGPERVSQGEVNEIRGRILDELENSTELGNSARRVHILILEGFLLYFNETPHTKELSPLLSLLDARLLLHTTLTHAVSRRKNRMTYVTVEGFFEDPPGYIENVVWPNYVNYHRHLFVDGDVEKGELSDWAQTVAGIKRQEREGMEMRELVEWGAKVIVQALGQAQSG